PLQPRLRDRGGRLYRGCGLPRPRGKNMNVPQPVAPLVEHFFRHEAGRLVSVLTRLFGWRHFDLVEDMVQATLLDALEAWRIPGGAPHPAGWGPPRRQKTNPAGPAARPHCTSGRREQ